MGIGKRIKEAREAKGLTQAELANIVWVTPSAITNYENETSHPKEPILYKLFGALNCDANYLFQDVVNIKVRDIQKDVLNRNYDALNTEGRKKLVDYSDDLVSGGRYMLTAAHGGGVKKVPAPDPSKDKEIERLTREAMLNSLEDDEEF